MNSIQKIKEEIAYLQGVLAEIQEECSHPRHCVTKKHEANTGGYDVGSDRYWTNFHCNLCDKRWTEEGSK